TIAAALFLVLSIAGLAAILLINQQLDQPIAWSKETGVLRSGLALKDEGGFIIGSKANTIERIDNEGNSVWEIATDGTVETMDMAPDGIQFAAATEDRQLLIIDSGSGEVVHSWNIPYPPFAIKWDQSG